MAQDITSKQAAFVGRYRDHVVALLDAVNKLANDKAEWDANGYATGAPQVDATSWVLTDVVVQSAAPQLTAAMVNTAVGAVESIRSTVASNLGYLIVFRS